ncbi:MAG: FMN-binding protein, partial [Anaerolineales bacterium]
YTAFVVQQHFAGPEAAVALAPSQPAATAVPPATDRAAAGRGSPTAPPAGTPPPTEAGQPTASALPTATPAANGLYRDGEYTGRVTDAYWGEVQVKVIIQNGSLSDVQFLDYPHDRRTSVRINNIAVPYLRTEAIQAQSARVHIISGATLTSEAFIESLGSALTAAK